MTTALVKFDPSVSFQLPDIFDPSAANADDLSGGVGPSFARISFRGKVWRVKFGGEEITIKDKEGEPARKLQVVIVKGNPALSKAYYSTGYVSGSDDAPDCWSNDGVRPHASVQTPCSETCASCPYNVFGSQITESGGKAKACSDARRLAVVAVSDIKSEAYGGPMMLRVPPASLKSLAEFNAQCSRAKTPYYAVVANISFDHESEYPKLLFTPVGVIQSPDLAKIIMDHREAEITDMILHGEVPGTVEADLSAGAAATAKPAPAAKPAATAKANGAAKPAAAAKPAPAAKPAAATEAEAVAFELEGGELTGDVQTEAPAAAAPVPEAEAEVLDAGASAELDALLSGL